VRLVFLLTAALAATAAAIRLRRLGEGRRRSGRACGRWVEPDLGIPRVVAIIDGP